MRINLNNKELKNAAWIMSGRVLQMILSLLPVIMSDIPEHRYLNDKYNFGLIIKENTSQALPNAVL